MRFFHSCKKRGRLLEYKYRYYSNYGQLKTPDIHDIFIEFLYTLPLAMQLVNSWMLAMMD